VRSRSAKLLPPVAFEQDCPAGAAPVRTVAPAHRPPTRSSSSGSAIVACHLSAPQIGSAQAARRTAPARARLSPPRRLHPPSCKARVPRREPAAGLTAVFRSSRRLTPVPQPARPIWTFPHRRLAPRKACGAKLLPTRRLRAGAPGRSNCGSAAPPADLRPAQPPWYPHLPPGRLAPLRFAKLPAPVLLSSGRWGRGGQRPRPPASSSPSPPAPLRPQAGLPPRPTPARMAPSLRGHRTLPSHKAGVSRRETPAGLAAVLRSSRRPTPITRPPARSGFPPPGPRTVQWHSRTFPHPRPGSCPPLAPAGAAQTQGGDSGKAALPEPRPARHSPPPGCAFT
jgi:hypothetical protein